MPVRLPETYYANIKAKPKLRGYQATETQGKIFVWLLFLASLVLTASYR